MVKELEKLCGLSLSQLQTMHKEMQEVLDFNFQHFYGNFREIITKELLDNFQGVFSVWNNGRIDGRGIDISAINFAEVQKRLLR